MTPHDLAAELGYSKLHPYQAQATDAMMDGHDVLLVASTGGGKTLPAHLITQFARKHYKDGLTLALGPLNALAADQQRRAEDVGFSCRTWNSLQTDKEKAETASMILNDNVDLLFTTAESLRGEELTSLLRGRVGLAWIDEVHTVVKDKYFRPAQGQAGRILDRVKPKIIYACTATSEPQQQQELLLRCGLQNPLIIRMPVDRPNLSYHKMCRHPDALIQVLATNPGKALVFTATVACSKGVAGLLQLRGYKAAAYYGELSRGARNSVSQAFMSGDTPIIAATDAFGLGIDIPDIRTIVCYDPAENVAAFHQQAGRAGRDGLPSKIYMAAEDAAEGFNSRHWLISSSFPAIGEMRKIWEFLKTADILGVTGNQAAIAGHAGVDSPRYLGPSAFRHLKRNGLVREQHEKKIYTYYACGKFEDADWHEYESDKDKALQQLSELERLWAADVADVAGIIGGYFNAA